MRNEYQRLEIPEPGTKTKSPSGDTSLVQPRLPSSQSTGSRKRSRGLARRSWVGMVMHSLRLAPAQGMGEYRGDGAGDLS